MSALRKLNKTIMKLRILLLLSCVLAFSYSCDEDDLVQLDPNRVVPESFFETEGQLETSVISGYATFRAQPLTGRFYFFLHDLMDDQHIGTSALQIAPELVRGQQNAASIHILGVFDALYDMVHRMNTALDGIAGNETVAEDIKTSLEAEARFLRGWAYGEISYLWGGAPIYLTRSLTLDDYKGRSSKEEVYAQAQSDLRFAADNLPTDRPADELGRATKGAALGFLARNLMQENKVEEAKVALNTLVALDKYKLVDNFGDNFTEENGFLGEALFEIIYAPNGGYNWDDSGDGDGTNSRSVRAQEYGPSWRNVVPTAALLNAFPAEELGDSYTDPRRGQTVLFEGEDYNDGNNNLEINYNSPPIQFNGREVYANIYKYGVYYKQVPGGFRLTDTHFILMRYADALLLLAEAEARTNGDLNRARGFINQVRARAGAPLLDDAGIPNANADQVLQAVIAERAVEFVSEQVRSRDLRRWHAADIVDAEAILGYSAEKFLLPIPQNEIINNPMVSGADQNPGYN